MAGVRSEKNTKGSWRKTISIALTSIMEMWRLCDPLGWVSAFQKVLQACEESPQSDPVLPTPRCCKLTRSVAHMLHKLHNLRLKKRGDGSWGVSGFICLQPACSTLDTDPGYATPTFTLPLRVRYVIRPCGVHVPVISMVAGDAPDITMVSPPRTGETTSNQVSDSKKSAKLSLLSFGYRVEVGGHTKKMLGEGA